MGSEPPLVSIRTWENRRPVSIVTDDTCAMWIDSSLRPTHWGVYCTTLDGVISTCVGKRRSPALRRLARNTSPAANGRPLRQTQTASSRSVATPAATTHHTPVHSLLTTVDVKLFS